MNQAFIDADQHHQANLCLQQNPIQRIATGTAPVRAFLHASEAAGPAAHLRRLLQLCKGKGTEAHRHALVGYLQEYGRRLAAASALPRGRDGDHTWSHYDQIGSETHGPVSGSRLAACACHAVEEQALAVYLQVTACESDPLRAMEAMILELDRLTRFAYERWRKLVAAATEGVPRAVDHPIFPVLCYSAPRGPSIASELWIMPIDSVPILACERYRLTSVFEPRREPYDARVMRIEPH